MNDHTLDDIMALLQRAPAAFEALLLDLPDTWTRRNEGAETWTVFNVVGHLVHGERTDWMPRIRRILQDGESKAFEPFDRFAQQRENAEKGLSKLLEEFATLRAENLQHLRAMHLKAEDFARRGRHPALGVVTLGNLVATWAAHDMTHLHQVSRILAHQTRSEVGPWSSFLGVLQCSGHSQ